MNKQHFLLGEVARIVGVRPYQITYLISMGVIEEPQLRINNKRIFMPKDVEAIKRVFAERHAEAARKEAHG